MNPLQWDAIRALQRNLDLNRQNYVNNSMENVPRTNEWDTYCEYSRHTVDEAQNSMKGMNVGWKELTPPSHNFHIEDVEVEGGKPLEMDGEDPELSRKRKELREIEERIILKKAAIALKTVEPFVMETTPSDFSCNEQSVTCKGATLKDRVNVVLQQRHPASHLSKVRSPNERMNSTRLSKDGLLQDHHPLKLRVKALMKQRCSNASCVLQAGREVPDVTPPPPSRSVASPAKEDSSVNKGFERFLSVLNKGVDMDWLSRIVNDDSEHLPLGEELLNIQLPAVENKPEPPLRSESQQSNGGASLQGCSGTSSGERKTDPPSQRDPEERSPSERLSLSDVEEKKNGKGGHCISSDSRSKSPSTMKKKEEEKPKVDEQSLQLQNILKTLGLSLEVEEMSKLADRTQERLYGKKQEATRADSRGQQESQQRASQRQASNSSSSSRLTKSRSFSSSPSRHQYPHSRDLEQSFERSRSRERNRDGLTRQDDNQDSKEAQRYMDKDKDGKYSKKISTYQHPYPQDQMYPHPDPTDFSAFPDYSLSQDSEDTAHHSDTYSAATGSYWTPTQDTIPPSLYPRCPYPQNTNRHFPGSVEAHTLIYPSVSGLEDINLFVNPDLSKSEGQIGTVSGPRCLQVIKPEQLKKGYKKKKPKRKRRSCWAKTREKWKQLKLAAKQNAISVEKVEDPLFADDKDDSENDSEDEESEEEKQPPTEMEIKANLRKTLEAFNQMVKQKVTQPANYPTSLTD